MVLTASAGDRFGRVPGLLFFPGFGLKAHGSRMVAGLVCDDVQGEALRSSARPPQGARTCRPRKPEDLGRISW